MTAMTAILMIDVQKMYLEQDRRDVLGWPPIWRLREVVGECRQLLAAGRAAGLPVIYTRSVHRPDGADITPRMRRLLAWVTRDGTTPLPGRRGTSAEIMDEVAPEPGDIVIDKLRWDAFHYNGTRSRPPQPRSPAAHHRGTADERLRRDHGTGRHDAQLRGRGTRGRRHHRGSPCTSSRLTPCACCTSRSRPGAS
jgi:nicotinamidase-related amidase